MKAGEHISNLIWTMDEFEQAKILNYLPHLLIHTECDHLFLSILQQRQVLSHEDIETIIACRKPTERNYTLYDIIQKRLDAYKILIEALTATNQNVVIGILETGITPKNDIKDAVTEKLLCDTLARRFRPIQYKVRDQLVSFTGRNTDLALLHNKVFRDSKNETVVSRITCVVGENGVGKTELVRKFIFENRHIFEKNIIWLDAGHDVSLRKDFLILAKDLLRIPTMDEDGSPKDMKTVITQVYKYFENHKSLVVFDNADNSKWLTNYLPMNNGGGSRPYIIITSTRNQWYRGIEIVNLKPLSEEEAMEMVVKELEIEDELELQVARRLCEMLEYSPCALHDAVSTIRDEQVTSEYCIVDYIGDLKKRQQEQLS